MKILKIFLGIVVVCVMAVSAAAGQAAIYLKVSVQVANIRAQADATGQVLAVVRIGAILEMLGEQGDWYVVRVPAGEQAQGQTGYIPKILVQAMGGAPAQPAPPPQPAPTAAPHVVRESGLPPGGNLLKGFSVKFGWMASPSGQSLGDTWIAGLGYDFALGQNFALGLEVQPSYRSYSDTSFEMKVIPVLAWAQLKAGVNLGRILKFLSFADGYAGIGLGGQAAFFSATVDGQSYSQTNFNFGLKVVLGTAIQLGAIKLLLEYQFVRISDPAVDPVVWRGFVMAGIRL
jgi:opacity protein-like surface antigen